MSRSAFGVVVLLLLPTGSRAEDPTERARALFAEGQQAAQNERWEEACAAFEASFALSPCPSSLTNLAAAQGERGLLIEALASYRLLEEQFAGEADPALLEAAQQAAQAIERRVAHARFTLAGMTSGDTVTVDGRPIDLDHRHHQAILMRRGAMAETDVDVAEGQSLDRQLGFSSPSFVNTWIAQPEGGCRSSLTR